MKVRPSVIIVHENCLLTMRYVYGQREVFALPGGNPDPNEGLTITLERELMEELGLVVEIGELVLCGEVLWTEQNRDTLHMVYSARIVQGIPALNVSETTALELVWLPVSKLESTLLYPNVGRQIVAYLNENIPSTYIGVIDQPFLK